MRKFLFLSLAAVTIGFNSCNNEDLGTVGLKSDNVSVSLPEAESRTALNGLQVVWSTDDAISVFAQNNSEYTNNQGTITSGVGQTSADFTVTIDGTTKVAAAYPYTATSTYDGTTISLTMPTTHAYVENGISGAPMAALINESNQNALIAFKNAGALMGLTVNNIPAGYNQAILTSKGDEAIAGACEITFDSNGNPTMKTATTATDKTITITFTAATELTNKTFHFPIPVDNYTSLELSISNGTDTKVLKTKALNAERSARYKSTLTLDAVTGSTPVEVSGAEAANQSLNNGNNSLNVTILETETNPTISLPNSENQTSLSFETIPTGTTVTVTASTDATSVSEEVTISASSDATSSNNFNINLPNSTVTLGANGETATYNEVTAATASNTLIVGKGVTVQSLKVKQGNARVKNGAQITNVERTSDNGDTKTYIIYEGTIPSGVTSTDNLIHISAAEYDLIAKFNNGGTQTITLSEDVELTQPLTLSNENANITLNLGTYSLTNKTAYDYDACGETECYVFEVKAGTLNISGNGSVNAIGGADYDMAVFANGTGKVNISGGKFTNTGKENDGSDLIYVRDNAVVTISGGEFEAGNLSTDVGNQYVALNLRDANRSTASITVTGGKFHKFNPANNVSEGALTNFTTNNTLVAVSGTEGAEVYEVINLTNGYTLTSNIEIATPIVINTTGSIDFNLGTYSLTNKTAYDYDDCGETECYVFEVQAGTLNVSGNGSVNAIGGADYDMAVFANSTGKVNISGGKFINTGKENDGSDLIYVRDNAVVTISGGEFEAGNKSSDVGDGTVYVALNLRGQDDTTASIAVTGGKFYKFNPANPGTESTTWNESHTNGFVAEGYSVFS